ncbi:MAG: SRPBCC family protein, partial [Pseudomonadota bacterium]
MRHENSAYDFAADEPVQQSMFWFLWPNTTFNILPGAEELNISCVRPLDLENSWFGGHSFSTSGDFDAKRMAYTADVLVPEDIGLCESVQRGLKSKGYSQGPLVVDPD